MNTTTQLPDAREMYQALIRRDAEFEGIFFVGVRTTGVFCRPTCPARKPKLENVEFFASTRDALCRGYRPCKRCQPLHAAGHSPDWLDPLLERLDREPQRRWTDRDLAALHLEPTRVRRWFKANHGMTFQAFSRARRLGMAFQQIRSKQRDTLAAGLEHGFDSPSGFRAAFQQWFGRNPGEATGAEAIHVRQLLTPLGPMIAAATGRGVCLLEFADRRMLETQFQRLRRIFHRPFVLGDHDWLSQLDRELLEYFRGTRREFDVALDVQGTPFQTKVWQQLQSIPYATTLSYDGLAKAIGHTNGQRAVGRANGDNRIAIVIPCHRVIRSDGALCGYGGGLWRKQWLLQHERDHARDVDPN